MATRQKKKPTAQGARSLVFSSLSFVVICAALLFGMSVFFRVSEIEVEGANRYSQQEIQEASGVKNGDSLMLLNRAAVAEAIQSKLLYLGGVRVTRKLPNTLVISVEESGGLAVIDTDSGLWLMDKSSRLLEPCPPGEIGNYIRIIGLGAVKPEAGKKANVAEDDKLKLDYLQPLLEAIAANELKPEIASLDLRNPVNVELDYQNGRFKVRLGGRDKLDYKLGLLREVAEKLEPEDRGVIDLSQDKRAQFSPGVE